MLASPSGSDDAMRRAAARWFWMRVLRRSLDLSTLRYDHRRRSALQRGAHWAVRQWLAQVGNHIGFPLGLTLLGVARRRR